MPEPKWRIVSAAVLVAAVLVAVFVGEPRWLVNDDLAMSWFASGSFTGTPRGHLVFVGRPLGIPIARLYTLTDAVAWYTLVMVGSVGVALWTVGQVAGANRRLQIGWTAVALPSMFWAAQTPNFTVTAVVCCAGGAMAIVVGTARRCDAVAWSGPLLVALGYTWRSEAIVVTLLLLTIPLGLAAGTLLRSRDRMVRLAWLGSAALVLTFASHTVTVSCLGTSASACAAWEEYDEYNGIRGSFQGAPRLEGLGGVAGPALGWTPAAFDLFSRFATLDDPVFGLDAMRAADDAVPPPRVLTTDRLDTRIETMRSSLGRFLPWLLLWAAAIVIPAIWSEPWRRRAVLFVVLAATMPATLLLVSSIRLPPPIVAGVVVSFGLGLVGVAALPRPDTGRRHRFAVREPRPAMVAAAMVATCLVTVLAPTGVLEQRSTARALRTSASLFADAFSSAAEDRLVVAEGTVANFVVADPYDARDTTAGLLIGGWPVFSPHWYERKERLGFPDDLYGHLLSDGDDRVYFMALAGNAQTTADFLVEQLGLADAVQAVCVEEVLPGICVWTFEATPT